MITEIFHFSMFACIVWMLAACAPAEQNVEQSETGSRPTQDAPVISIHYLGHSSFFITFGKSITLLTDYGESNAYGLDSPVFDLGDVSPVLVTYSHHHADHDRGQTFPDATIVDCREISLNGVSIQAVPVTENESGDNCGYLIKYRDISIFHAGDPQGEIDSNVGEEVWKNLKSQLPERVDVFLLPIGWTHDIIEKAAAFLAYFQPRVAIPMHYWSPAEKELFLSLLRADTLRYSIVERQNASWEASVPESQTQIRIVSLTAGPYQTR